LQLHRLTAAPLILYDVEDSLGGALVMPVHDWTKVDAGIFHDFHCAWIIHLKESLNEGLLPDGFYAMAEQHARDRIPDVLTLRAPEPDSAPHPPPGDRGVALADAPPRVSRKLVADLAFAYHTRRRTLTIRHVSDHRIVALLEIISPGNKDRASCVADFVEKVDSALERGIHVLVADLFPPGKHDPQGIHGAIWMRYGTEDYIVPPGQRLTTVSYRADGATVEAYVEHLTVGDSLTEMPMFLTSDFYINIPLEATYQAAYRGVPAFWRDVLERKQPTT
jgi:hypothetical protein